MGKMNGYETFGLGHDFNAEVRSATGPLGWIWVGVILISLIGGAVTARVTGVLPHWVPLIGQDSGVAACEAISESAGKQIDGGAGQGATDAEKIRAVRALFADSGDDDIRQHGVALMDLSAQVAAADKEPDLSALALIGPITTAYAGLAGACAEHGFTIPPMGS